MVYMAVRADRYELPVALFETTREAADWAGVLPASVHTMLWQDEHPERSGATGKRRGYRMIRVVMEE